MAKLRSYILPFFRGNSLIVCLFLILLVACGTAASPIKEGGAVYALDPESPEAFVAVSAGLDSHCALRANGAVDCKGAIIYDSHNFLPRHQWNQYERGTEPKNARFIDLSVGDFYICGLLAAGNPFCWGEDRYGEASPPVQDTFTAISSGRYHTCALLTDGSPVCWGQRDLRIVPSADEKLIAISSGHDKTCALRLDGFPVCWAEPFTSSPILTGDFVGGGTKSEPSPWVYE